VSRNTIKLLSIATTVCLGISPLTGAETSLSSNATTISPMGEQKGSSVGYTTIDGASEDEWLIRAIWLEEQKSYTKATQIYAKLFDTTRKKEYLFKEVSSSMHSKHELKSSLSRLKLWLKANPKDIVARRLLIVFYTQEKSYLKAKELGESLIKDSEEAKDLEIVANPYLYSGDYKKGLELLNKLYEMTHDEKVLLRSIAIMTKYQGKTKESIRLLETHIRFGEASEDAYKLLIDLYIKTQDIKKILELYRKLYDLEPNEEYLRKIIEIYVYLNDFKGLIGFLEKLGGSEDLLYDLYKKEKIYDKAIPMAQEFYRESQHPQWLAEEGILTFEAATDKNDPMMVARVVELFDMAIKMGVDDSIYLNYYGYTLIDKEIDIDKGIEIIKNALKQQPNNAYYLDSLAWGYYKKGQCKKAYKYMKKVIDIQGDDEIEVKEHWRVIKECMKSTIISNNVIPKEKEKSGTDIR